MSKTRFAIILSAIGNWGFPILIFMMLGWRAGIAVIFYSWITEKISKHNKSLLNDQTIKEMCLKLKSGATPYVYSLLYDSTKDNMFRPLESKEILESIDDDINGYQHTFIIFLTPQEKNKIIKDLSKSEIADRKKYLKHYGLYFYSIENLKALRWCIEEGTIYGFEAIVKNFKSSIWEGLDKSFVFIALIAIVSGILFINDTMACIIFIVAILLIVGIPAVIREDIEKQKGKK